MYTFQPSVLDWPENMKVMVEPASVEVWVHLYSTPPFHTMNVGMVTWSVPVLVVMEMLVTVTAPSTMVPVARELKRRE